jgi:carboxylesterase type B
MLVTRWRSPQDVPKAKEGVVLNATQYGATCPQAITGTSYTQQDENCLNLNIWAPSSGLNKPRSPPPGHSPPKRPTALPPRHISRRGGPPPGPKPPGPKPPGPDSSGSGFPVFVYMYGGAMVTGSSSNPQLQGNNFARKGVIFVTFNTRESIYAYPNSAELGGSKESQNFGILDVNKALEWVHDNIAGK